MNRLFTFIVFIIIASILFPSDKIIAQDRGNGFGLGIIAGEPTGISAQKWMSDENALAAAAAWSFSGRTSFNFHVDYQFYNFNLVQADRGELSFYWGVGARSLIQEKRNGNDLILGARIPVGLNYHIEDTPLAAFVEVVPKLNLFPDTKFDIGGGIGIRYFF